MTPQTIGKGMLALQRSNAKAEKITIGGETFYFKKLTIAMEEELDRIVKENQDDTLKVPERPADDAGEEAFRAFADALIEHKQRAAKAFRKLTAEIMKYVLMDDENKPLFAPEDEVYENLNNVYAECFFRAYGKFRQGAEVNPATAEERFPK
jgi:hypothetical protein